MTPPRHIGLIMQGGSGWMGGAEYIKNLALALRLQPGRSFQLSLVHGQPLDSEFRTALGGCVDRFLDFSQRPRPSFFNRAFRQTERAFTRAVQAAGIDLLYPLTYDNRYNLGLDVPRAEAFGKTRWIGWIPDFQHRSLPELFKRGEIAKRDAGIAELATQARCLVFSSQAAAHDFRTFHPGSAARAEVLHFCTSPNPAWFEGDPLAIQRHYHLPDRFFLVSNQLWQHKNHLLVVEALGLLAERAIRPHFVWTGQLHDFRNQDYLGTLLRRMHELGVAGQVSLLGLIPRADQVQLMRRSLAVVQPSLCEGWSTVVEDARTLGKATLLSDLEVHREQNPPGARFFARQSAEALATALAESWQDGAPGPDSFRETEAREAAATAQMAFGQRFLEIARDASA
jgi:glycosyltransferase involved in cell wall biosynthesis